MKNCSNPKCSQINPQSISCFYKDKVNHSGLKSWCKFCMKELCSKWHKDNPDKANIKTALWYKNNPEKSRVSRQKWYKDNKEITKMRSRSWGLANRSKRNSYCAKYKALKLQRTPKWLTVLDWKKIQEWYDYANLFSESLGVLYSVDHIIPLKGKNISGLHVPTNLQIMSMSDNSSKNNKY